MLTKMRESKGFTLVELMIVVAIIGILAAVAVPYYQKYIQKSRLTSLVFPGLHSIETNLASFYSLQSHFPVSTTFPSMTADANSDYCTFTPSTTIGGIVVTIRAGGGPGGKLVALQNQVFTAVPQTAGGMIKTWTLSGDLAIELGLAN